MQSGCAAAAVGKVVVAKEKEKLLRREPTSWLMTCCESFSRDTTEWARQPRMAWDGALANKPWGKRERCFVSAKTPLVGEGGERRGVWRRRPTRWCGMVWKEW